MQIKMSNLFWAATIGAVLLNSPGLTQKYEASQALRARQLEAGIDRKAALADAKLLRARSDIALERVEAGCIPVSAGEGNNPLVSGTPVGNSDGSPLAEGQLVCNSRGDTAVVAVAADGGTSIIDDVATVSSDDLADYKVHYESLLANVHGGASNESSRVPSTKAVTKEKTNR